MRHTSWALTALLLLLPNVASAICGVTYRAQAGDTLFSIAEMHYGSPQKWSLIYYANQASLVGNSVAGGEQLQIPCPPNDLEAEATPLKIDDAELKLLTGGGYAPFTDQNLPGGGMVTELVNAAMELTPQPVPYSLTWENDWSKHLFPELNEKKFDMGFPWLKPDCAGEPDNERCKNFHFSEPLMVMPIMLFTRTDSDFTFTNDSDILGRAICRPAGYFTHDLDSPDRRWITDDKIDFVVGDSPTDCFNRVANGEVDAATVNLFLGATTLVEMGLRDQITPQETPVSEQGLHIVISKRHWRGTTFLYRVNTGLSALRDSGRYQEIVSRHLEGFWSLLK
ncbi:hypothetical protein RB2150_10846 [Rhodobacteraceae bacterium HTCC2150]|nr:hypothetical protein RB2150_10846 [Rhodobacteraceae bacterium HTCC2150]